MNSFHFGVFLLLTVSSCFTDVGSEQNDTVPSEDYAQRLIALDEYHGWVKKLNQALYQEPIQYSEMRVGRVPVINAMEYPGSNTTKIESIKKVWNIHKQCLIHRVKALGRLKIVYPEAVAVLEDGTLKIKCMVCTYPSSAHIKSLWFKKTRMNENPELIIIPEDELITITDDNSLNIFKVSQRDAGIYFCQSGSAKSHEIYVHILKESELTVAVHPETARNGPYETKHSHMDDMLVLTTHWTDWNQCSTCGMVGRRTRWGACFVQSPFPLTLETGSAANAILSLFPYGLPCRSPWLPREIRNRYEVANRPNEIMIGMCKVPCVDEIFEVRNNGGELVTSVNNSAGVYSNLQVPPKLPPIVVRQMKWPTIGEPLTIACPGSVARDTPTDWRINAEKRLSILFVNSSSKGRVHIDERDRLVFKKILSSDGHRYVCYQNNEMTGVVTLIPVERNSPKLIEIDTILLTLFLGIILLTYLARMYYYNRKLVPSLEKTI